MTEEPLFEVTHLEKYFDQSTSIVDTLLGRNTEQIQAVDDVSFRLTRGDVQGVIGESGCGKTTLLRTLVGLYEPTAGEIRYRGRDVSGFDAREWKEFRRNVQIVFQDPFNSLDPKMTVEETLREPLLVHGIERKDERIRRACEQVGLPSPDEYLPRLPKQLSGGEKQRVSIARALVLEPDVILADEPVSMLDVSTQAAVLNLLEDLITETDVAMVYISHDLSTVSAICDWINVMYLGRFVETRPTRALLETPKHPYSEALIDAIPIPDPHHDRERTTMEGAPREPVGLGEGCRFRERCPDAMDICEQTPRDVPVEDGMVACHLYDEETPGDARPVKTAGEQP